VADSSFRRIWLVVLALVLFEFTKDGPADAVAAPDAAALTGE